MSPNEKSKSAVGRQMHLPLSTAFHIAMNSVKIRFGRSVITAGGIFLGIAFLSTILTQRLMQWPVAEQVNPGLIKMDGQINGPGMIEAFRPVPIQAGLQAGIPEDVIKAAPAKGDTFNLSTVVQGMAASVRAERNLKRVKAEDVALKKVKDREDKLKKAKKAQDEKLKKAKKPPSDSSKDNEISPFYSDSSKDKEISVDEAVKAGVPEKIAEHLAGQGKTFKGSALDDAINKWQGYWIHIWQARADRSAIFKKVDRRSINKLADEYAITLNEAIANAKGKGKDADTQSVMVVNLTGRKTAANFDKDGQAAGRIKLKDGDNVLVPDRNTRYRMWWLVVMSLLVCTVGITNSMLMSVTERFKEIGTMKCLGALDKFVVTLLVLESGMMGIVASIAGWFVGTLVIVLAAGSSRGWDILATISPADVLKTFVVAVFAGVFLTLVATIAPAFRAASMPPAMALRSEI